MGLCSSRHSLAEQQPHHSKPYRRHLHSQDTAPPAWEPAPERSHRLGLFDEASDEDWESAEVYCATHPPVSPRMLASDVIDRIRLLGCRAWGLEHPTTPRFVGRIDEGNQGNGVVGIWKVCTQENCKDICLLSDLPVMAGLYDIRGKRGIYYEVRVNKMEGTVAIGTSLVIILVAEGFHDHQLKCLDTGTACKPYPSWRMPGWNRLSAGLHLDDMRKFFEDPHGGRDYSPELSRISSGDIIGCGYQFDTGTLFFTHNGHRLPNAFTGIYLPRVDHDVYAAIGLDGANEIEVNFGSSVFQWYEGNDVAWRVDGHVGYIVGSGPGQDEKLPSYSEATSRFR